MGTRSLTIVIDAADKDNPEELLVLYRQMDGYPSGHGQELAKFLSDMTIINGIGSQSGKIANGAGCLAAQLVAHFKIGVGGFYICAPGSRGQEYNYIVTTHGEGEPITIKCLSGDNEVLFEGNTKNFSEFCKLD